MFNSAIHGRNTTHITNFHQSVLNLSLFQKESLNMGIKINNNLPPFMKRTSDNSKEFESFLRNIFYSNPICTSDEYFSHNTNRGD
jgi:hypothetical protein